MNSGFIRAIPRFGAIPMFLVFALACFSWYSARGKLSIKKRDISKNGISFAVFTIISMIFTALIVYRTLESEVTEIMYGLMLLIANFYIKQRPVSTRRFFVKVLLLDNIIININTSRLLIIDSNISRLLATAGGAEAVSEAGYSTFMLAGYDYIYTSVLMVIFIATNWTDLYVNAKKTDKAILLVYLITSIFTVLLAEYTIAVIMLIFGVLLAFVTRNGFKMSTFFAFMVAPIVLFLTLELALMGLIESQLLGQTITSRLDEILSVINGNISQAADFSSRLSLYYKTIKALPSTIVTGAYEMGASGRELLGMHTEWIDRLALYGAIRFVPFAIFLAKSFKNSTANYKAKNTALYISIVVLGFLNPMVSQWLFLMFYIFVPFMNNRQDISL